MRFIIFSLFTFYFLLSTLFGCGYSIRGKAQLPFDSIQIEKIENLTTEPKLQDMLYRALTEEFLRQGVNVSSGSDYKLSGRINLYELRVLSVKEDIADEYEVIISGDFKLIGLSGDIKELKAIGTPFIVSFSSYGAIENVIASKELASEEAIRNMAVEIVAAIIYSGKE
ncbi:MAG: LPS assembly lipoprotein LptE [Nitrospirota bacterium]